METLAEKEQRRLLRKSRSDLIVAGRAVLAFGVWTMFKIIVIMLVGRESSAQSFIDTSSGLSAKTQLFIVVLITAFFEMFSLLIHYIIYRGAVKEGHGKKTGWFYLVVTVIYIALNALSIGITVTQGSFMENPLSYISSILFDLALVIGGIDVFYNGVRSRRLSRMLSGGNHER